MPQTYKIYINGKWISSDSGEVFESTDPATEKSIGNFQKGNKEDVNKAVESAEKALDSWKETPAPKRGEILLKIADLLKKNKESIAKIMTMEMGKPFFESLGDIQEAIDTAEYFAGEGRRLFGHTTPSELKDKFAMTIRMPVGIVGLITPWNFPIAIPAWKTMPALICGNTIVFKPSSDTPLTAIKFIEILEKAGVPKGVVNLVTGPGEEVGMGIVKHKKIRGISFTGNRDTGKTIIKEAGLKKVGLELGGKNGIIIMDDADMRLVLDGVLWGGYGTTGQRCTAASRVILNEKIKEKFERILVNRLKKLKVGSGLLKTTEMGPLVNKSALEKTQKYTEIGLNEGAKLLHGGKPLKRKGFFFQPTLFTDVSKDMRIAQEEIFGPVVSLLSFKNIDEAIDIMNSVEYGLSSSIYTRDIRNAFKAIQGMETGIVYVNSPTIGAEVHLPFGGVKNTGHTREAGISGIEEFSHIKTVYIDYSNKLQRAQIDSE